MLLSAVPLSDPNLSVATKADENGKLLLHDAAVKPPLNGRKQREVVKRLMKQADQQGLQIGDTRFVLSAKWWERWCEFVDFNEDNDPLLAAETWNLPPSRIDNLPLLHVSSETPLDELMGGPLRPQLKENYHYVLIPREVWDALLIWYGGGPTIARFIVQVGDPELGNAFNRVEVYPVSEDLLT